VADDDATVGSNCRPLLNPGVAIEGYLSTKESAIIGETAKRISPKQQVSLTAIRNRQFIQNSLSCN